MHLPDAISSVRPSIIQVLIAPTAPSEGSATTELRGPQTSRSPLGTGFLVHPDGFALTACHVVVEAERVIAEIGGELRVGLAVPELTGSINIRASFELLGVTVVEKDPRHDLALLLLNPNPFQSGRPSGVSRIPGGGMAVNGLYGLASLWVGELRDGEAVAVSGYPSIAPALVTTHGVVASATAFETFEEVDPGGSEGWALPKVHDSYLIDAAVNPGNSGGPVYLVYQAAVVGVCVAFRPARMPDSGPLPLVYNSGIAVAVPLKYGLELLSAHVA